MNERFKLLPAAIDENRRVLRRFFSAAIKVDATPSSRSCTHKKSGPDRIGASTSLRQLSTKSEIA